MYSSSLIKKGLPSFALTLFSLNILLAQSHKQLHERSTLIDTHNDFPSTSIEKKLPLDADLKGKTHSDLKRFKEGGVDIQVFSIYCDGETPAPYAWANREIDSVYAWAKRNPSKMMMVFNSRDLENALTQKKLGAMMGVEGGHMIENNLSKLDSLYRRGARYMTLTWNNSTDWATSALDETSPNGKRPKGLSAFGKKVVGRMNQLGMLVDLSHVGEKTFWDVMAITTKPVIASHSNAYALCGHRRNLKDDQIKAIGKNGGVIHLNFNAPFVDPAFEKRSKAFFEKYRTEIDQLEKKGTTNKEARLKVAARHASEMDKVRPTLEQLLDHLDYIVRLIGVDHVGMGSDFDGIEFAPYPLNGVENFPLITEGMKKRNYSDEDINKILGGNFIRVLKANEK